MYLRKTLYLLGYILIVAGCSKKDSAARDSTAPVVEISSPPNDLVLGGPQDLVIAGKVTDNEMIREIHIEVSNNLTGEGYLHVHIHPSASMYTFSQVYTIQPGIFYKIRVIADDASANSGIAQRQVTCF